MLKKYLIVLATAGALSMFTEFAAAQDNQNQNAPTNAQQDNAQQNTDPQAQPGQENGGRRHGFPDPAERVARLTKRLNLSSDQQRKVLNALQSERSQMQSVHQDSSLSRQDRRAKMMEIRQTTDSQIRGVLNPNQQNKWDRMQAKREQRMQNRGQGQSGANPDQPAPPAQ